MKQVLIIGATGSLARYVVEALKELPNLRLTLFCRDKSLLRKNEAEGCTIVEGDAMNLHSIREAMNGQDIVYVNLAGDLEIMAVNIVRAMQEKGVKRIIAISSIGIYDTPLKPVLLPYRKLADEIETSGLDYTILRPDWFTDENTINYSITYKGAPEKGSAVSRKSIAAFIAELIKDPRLHIAENLGISQPG